jgi:hypothetical protein
LYFSRYGCALCLRQRRAPSADSHHLPRGLLIVYNFRHLEPGHGHDCSSAQIVQLTPSKEKTVFRHIKELQFDAHVSGPDPAFAKLLLEQFGGGNGELKAAMQYFTQAIACRHPFPDTYDLLMDIATEEFSHLEIVGATITMLLEGINGELKNAAERTV